MGYLNIYTYIIHKKNYLIFIYTIYIYIGLMEYIYQKVAICSLWTVCPCLGSDLKNIISCGKKMLFELCCSLHFIYLDPDPHHWVPSTYIWTLFSESDLLFKNSSKGVHGSALALLGDFNRILCILFNAGY